MTLGSTRRPPIAALALALGVAACGGDPTQVLVITDSDLAVPAQLDELSTEVTAPDGSVQQSRASLAGAPLPRTLSLVHEDGPLGPFEVRVVGRRGGTQVVERRARFSFVEGEVRVLVMHLVAACIGRGCPADQTCGEVGCRPVDVARGELAPWTGTPPRLAPGTDAGPPPADAGPDTGAPCVPVAELCNARDDDCDAEVDEDFDLMTDTDHCGMCGNRCRGRDAMCCMGACAPSCP